MAETIVEVFLYGSLLPGHSNHHVVTGTIRSSRPGRVEGRLVDFGAYPALVRDGMSASGGSAVRGLWIEVDGEGLAAMDDLEAFIGIEEVNDYDRIWTRDLDRPEQSGWVYVWESARGCPPVPGDYWPDYFARKSPPR